MSSGPIARPEVPKSAPFHACVASYQDTHLYGLNTNNITLRPKPFSQQNTPLGLPACMSLLCVLTACIFCAAERAAVLAAAIKAAGVKAGGRVGIYAPNVPNWMLVIQACNRSSLQVGEPSWTASTALCAHAPSPLLSRSTILSTLTSSSPACSDLVPLLPVVMLYCK